MRLVLFLEPFATRQRAALLALVALGEVAGAAADALELGERVEAHTGRLEIERLEVLASFVRARNRLEAWIPRLERAASHLQSTNAERIVVELAPDVAEVLRRANAHREAA